MENTIFFGNSFNLVSPGAKTWNELLSEIANNSDDVIKDIPNTLQYEDLYLARKIDLSKLPESKILHSEEFQIKYRISELVSSFSFNELHEILASLNSHSYITTNYDHTFEDKLIESGLLEKPEKSDTSEQLYSVRRVHSYYDSNTDSITKVWPIHGEYKHPKSIMLGYDHYCGSIGKVDSYIKGRYSKYGVKIPGIIDRLKSKDTNIHSWIDLFFMNNIHIIGFGLDYSELDIWWLLNKRMRFIHDGETVIQNKITIYGCDDCLDKQKAKLLDSFGVQAVILPKPESDWFAVNKELLAMLKDNL